MPSRSREQSTLVDYPVHLAGNGIMSGSAEIGVFDESDQFAQTQPKRLRQHLHGALHPKVRGGVVSQARNALSEIGNAVRPSGLEASKVFATALSTFPGNPGAAGAAPSMNRTRVFGAPREKVFGPATCEPRPQEAPSTSQERATHAGEAAQRPVTAPPTSRQALATVSSVSGADGNAPLPSTSQPYSSCNGKERTEAWGHRQGAAVAQPADSVAQAVHVREQHAALNETLRLRAAHLEEVRDIDAGIEDAQFCPEIANDVMEVLFVKETQFRPDGNYMVGQQADINPNMRAILVDWLVEVAEEYRLTPDTLFLAVNFTDRLLSVRRVAREQLQLAGVSALFVAAKYEEIYPPNVADFVYITDNTYTAQHILAMESVILNSLDFCLTAPTSKTFLNRFIQAADAMDEPLYHRARWLSRYLAELALLDYGMLAHAPSAVAAAALLLALHALLRSPCVWTPTLAHYTRYSAAALEPAARALHALHAAAPRTQLPAVNVKYAHHKHMAVCSIPAPACLPDALFAERP